ncbi:MAG: rhomboid family intramembrane serine protease [Lachnospiraceae bacterium]|nr:rhomboid family intramembrane serine protease [bacterium]MDY5517565.1 rhomboid family intramembrane serine protease [Lachnospiraceae bacterium]
MDKVYESIKKWLNINSILIVVNILVWLVLCTLGDTRSAQFMYEHGALYPMDVLNGEWYRLFSAMFLHFGAEHLISNMFMQYFLGDMLLRAFSQWQFALIYLFAGIGGNITSLLMMLVTGDVAVAAGASGAIYGIVGALLWVVLRNGGKFESISVPRMLLATALYIGYGFTTEGVDAWAHLGGALIGFLMAILLYRRKVTVQIEQWDS